MNPVVWRFCRLWVKLRRVRTPPAGLSGTVWYFAFGSNMNERLFRERRHMTPLETRIGRLDLYRLCFTVAGGREVPAHIKRDVRCLDAESLLVFRRTLLTSPGSLRPKAS